MLISAQRHWLKNSMLGCLARKKLKRNDKRRPGGNLLRLEALEDRLTPTTFTVNLTTDTNVAFGITAGQLDMGGEQNGTDAGDLRYCLSQANMTPGPNTIDFAVPASSTIVLNQVLMIYNDVIIDGSTTTNLTISGGGTSRVFFVTAGNITIEGLTIANGLAQGGAGANGVAGAGAGGRRYGRRLANQQRRGGGSNNVTFTNDKAQGGAGGSDSGPGGAGGGGGAGELAAKERLAAAVAVSLAPGAAELLSPSGRRRGAA